MWGIIPAAGAGSRIQPLAFSKELLPVGSRKEGSTERPKAVSEYLIERMVLGGASKICFVIGPGKSDILEYYGGSNVAAQLLSFVVQPQPAGLCDAVFRAAQLIAPTESVVVGLPDTIWFPAHGLRALGNDHLEFLLFPVGHPELFDAVVFDVDDRVSEIQVKQPRPASNWIWGAFKMPGHVFHELHRLWLEREQSDEYFGTLVNAWISGGGVAFGRRAGEAYVDVGTVNGYRHAMLLLGQKYFEEPADVLDGASSPQFAMPLFGAAPSP